MLKRLAIIAVLLAAVAPMPGQAVEPTAQGGNNNQNQSQSKQGNPAQALTLVNKSEQPQATEDHSGQIAAEDKEHSVKLTSLPPVTIADKEKGFWDHVLDWGPWVANVLLAVVGILQVWLLLRTWKTIDRQANIMEKQAKDAQDSGAEATRIALATAKAAQKSAEAALLNAQAVINTERPWLIAHLKQFKEETIPEDGRLRLAWEVKNVGKTPAKLIEADAVAVFNLDAVPLPDVPIYGYFPETLENRILVPGDTYSFWAHWYELKEGRYICLEKQNIGPCADLLVVFGYVKYRDTFDSTKEHISRFCDCTFISGSKVGGHVTNWDSAPAEYTECT
jgi:hypothetical protein